MMKHIEDVFTVEEAATLLDSTGYAHPLLWGHDHFGVLLLIETLVVDQRGKMNINDTRIRADIDHPTRLNNGWVAQGHTDFDCLDDMEVFGFIVSQNNGPEENAEWYTLTERGWALAHMLRRSKGETGKREAPADFWDTVKSLGGRVDG